MDLGRVLIAAGGWKAAFPGAAAGALVVRDVRNPERSEALEARKRVLEQELRTRAERINGDGIGADPRMRAYADHYRRFGKTYHVKAQWESVAVKGKPIPTRAALVETMFMAELASHLLSAVHDLAAVRLPVRVDVTRDGDRYVQMNGRERTLAAGDMMMADGEGIISSVLHGPDQRTAVTPQTRDALFIVYAPAGIGAQAVRDHLADVEANVRLVAPAARTELLATLTADRP
jgi:DNA/RNA-binding domain of Phe-tRNA-synthetase-like protein